MPPFLFTAAISDIDSDYTSDINYPLAHSHHINLPVSQFGTYQGSHIPISRSHRDPDLDESLTAQDSFDCNYNEEVMSDGDYAPSIDPHTDSSYRNRNSKSPYHRNAGGVEYDHVDNNNIRNEIPYESDWQRSKNVSHDHWEKNGYHYEECNDSTSRPYDPRSADGNSNRLKPVPRSRGSTPQREANHRLSPFGNQSPVPPPRRNLQYDDSDNRSSPYHERRSDNSDPFYYNSRPADEW